MFLNNKTLTVGRKVIYAYLLIWCLPVLISTDIYLKNDIIIDKIRLEQTQGRDKEIESANVNYQNTSFISAAARAIRQVSPNYKKESPRIEYLLDLQMARLIALMATFIFGSFIVMFLISQIYQSFESIGVAISNLSQGQLRVPISIHGSQNAAFAGRELEKLRNRLIGSEQHQHNFLRHISHEIKTPLTSIKEGVQLLEDELQGPINDEQREITDILSSSTAVLQASIENLLNYNSALSTQQVRQRQMVNLKELIFDVQEKHTLTIKSKRLHLISDQQTQLAFVDRDQIMTVFDNLISNAIKHSPLGGRIWIRLDKFGDEIIFSIKDQGEGIKKDHLASVFDAFFVGETGPDTSQGPLKGTGLGLSLARQYVENHDGTIKALESSKGAYFEVSLPA